MKSTKIIVVGEYCIDEYQYGKATRISPEAPIPVLSYEKTEFRIGMAGNVVKNLLALGAEVMFVTVEGNKPYPDFISNQFLAANGIPAYYGIYESRKTIRKTRIIADKQQLLRIDEEDTHPINWNTEQELEKWIFKELPNYDSLLIQDYGKGMFTRGFTNSIIRQAKKQNKPIFVDPNPKNDLSYYEHCTLIKPNEKEAVSLLKGIKTNNIDDILEGIQTSLHCDYIVVTSGDKGMTGLDHNKQQTIYLPAYSTDTVDVTGAGDTVIAILAFLMSQNYSFTDAVKYANIGASIVVNKFGTSSVTWEELNEAFQKTLSR